MRFFRSCCETLAATLGADWTVRALQSEDYCEWGKIMLTSLGEYINHLRTAKDMSQEELAERAYASQTLIAQWERSKKPITPVYARHVARAFDLDEVTFMKRTMLDRAAKLLNGVWRRLEVEYSEHPELLRLLAGMRQQCRLHETEGLDEMSDLETE